MTVAKTASVTLTNKTDGDRGVHDAKGNLVMIAPGKSAVVELNEGEIQDAEAGEWFEVGPPAEDKPSGESAENDILTAIDMLDASNDEHWTNAGLPAVDAVSGIVGRTVTRAEINEAAPEFMRPAE